MIVKDGQNILDVCLQAFGSLEQLFILLNDNDLVVNNILRSGQDLTINNENIGDELIKNFVSLNNIVYNNSQNTDADGNSSFLPPVIGGDYNEDYSQDYF